MASRSVFGMICDVGTWLLRMPFHIYLALCANDASIVTHLEFSGAST
jgi:hypothetical protein